MHQKLIKWIGFIIAGVLMGGALLDSLSNAVAIVSPKVTYTASAIVIASWVFVESTIRLFRPSWVGVGNTRFRLHSLGPQIRLAIVGILALLWIPRLGDIPNSIEIPEVAIKLVNASDTEIEIERRGDFVIWYPNASFDGAPRTPGRYVLRELSERAAANEPLRIQARSELWAMAKILNAEYFVQILDRNDTDMTIFIQGRPGRIFEDYTFPFDRDTLSSSYIVCVIPDAEKQGKHQSCLHR
jgi:hypothetical protein